MKAITSISTIPESSSWCSLILRRAPRLRAPGGSSAARAAACGSRAPPSCWRRSFLPKGCRKHGQSHHIIIIKFKMTELDIHKSQFTSKNIQIIRMGSMLLLFLFCLFATSNWVKVKQLRLYLFGIVSNFKFNIVFYEDWHF